MNLAVATGNAHKLQEFSEILQPLGWTVRSIRDWLPDIPEPEETEPDFAGNSALKCRVAIAALRASGLDNDVLPYAVIADDSGLAVDVLNGEPGVFSARFADRAGRGSGDAANRRHLIFRLQEAGIVLGQHTPAAFVCALHLIPLENGDELACQGSCHGFVGVQESGEGGFGYDSLFSPLLEDGSRSAQTFGELSSAIKHSLSHRGRALQELARLLSERSR